MLQYCKVPHLHIVPRRQGALQLSMVAYFTFSLPTMLPNSSDYLLFENSAQMILSLLISESNLLWISCTFVHISYWINRARQWFDSLIWSVDLSSWGQDMFPLGTLPAVWMSIKTLVRPGEELRTEQLRTVLLWSGDSQRFSCTLGSWHITM